MTKLQLKNTLKNSFSYPIIAGNEYSDIMEAQEKDHKNKNMKMTQEFKEEMNKSLEKVHENTQKNVLNE